MESEFELNAREKRKSGEYNRECGFVWVQEALEDPQNMLGDWRE